MTVTGEGSTFPKVRKNQRMYQAFSFFIGALITINYIIIDYSPMSYHDHDGDGDGRFKV